jgi:hypothetical protein
MTKTDTKKNVMIQSLESSLGVVSVACQKAELSRETHYKWYREDQDYKQRVDNVKNICLDFAESKLFEQIQDNNTTSTIFYLKTQGKNRGYVERQEVDLGTENHFRIEILEREDDTE